MANSRGAQMTQPKDALFDAFDNALSELFMLQEQVDTACSSLASSADPGGDKERALVVALAERKKAATRLGMLCLQWSLQGGFVVLTESPSLTLVEDPEPELDLDALLTAEPAPEPAHPEPPEAPPEPEPEPAPPPTPKGKPASTEALSALQGWANGTHKPSRSKVLEGVFNALREASRVRTIDDFNTRASGLLRVTGDLDQILFLPRSDQKAVIGLLVATARHLLIEAAPKLGHPVLSSRVESTFPTMSQWSKIHNPGFVQGLRRHHQPFYEDTWAEEAQHWWARLAGPQDREEDTDDLNPEQCLSQLTDTLEEDEPDRQEVCGQALQCLSAGMRSSDPRLVKALHPHLSLLTKEPKLKAVRKAIRDFRTDMKEEGQRAEKDTEALPDDWPHLDLTVGKTLLIVGGDSRVRVTKRIQDTFRFGEVIWESGWNLRRIDSLAQQVESGNIHMVVFLARFMNHACYDMLTPACKAVGTPFLTVESGYGVSLIRHTMERVFSNRAEG